MSDDVIYNAANFPVFNPGNFEIRRQIYGNTGGHCMVGTVEFYLPDAADSVWVNCNDETAAVYTIDTVWNEDGSGSYENSEDYLLYAATFDTDSPDTASAAPWLKMIKETLAYTIEQEAAYFQEQCNFSIPVAWLPDSLRAHEA